MGKINGYNKIRVQLLASTPEPAALVRHALDVTMKKVDFDKSPGTASEKAMAAVKKMGHTSVFEHVSFTFAIAGASRSFLAQITRHRMASFTSGSQHYQDYRDYGGRVDPSLVDAPEMIEGLETCLRLYEEMVDRGVPAYEARQVLPNMMENNLIVTINARSLLNFLNLRLCRRNTAEIRHVAWKMRALAISKFPELFQLSGPDCFEHELGKCVQGRMSCGKPWTPESACMTI